MAEARLRNSSWFAFLVLAPLFAVSVPSVIFCALEALLWLHGRPAKGPVVFHLAPQNMWDRLFVAETVAYQWISRWNSMATLAATLIFVSTLVRPRWRAWAMLALIPYTVLLCADFTLRWRYALMP